MVIVLDSLSGFGTPDGGKRLLKKHKKSGNVNLA